MDAVKVYTVEEFRTLVTTRAAWAERAIVRLYREQTPSEQEAETTVYHNGRGFSAVDAEILTSFAKQVERMGEATRRDNGHKLSDKQLAIAFKRLGKYAKQLHRLAYGEDTPAVVRVEPKTYAVEASSFGLVPGESYVVMTYVDKTFYLKDIEFSPDGEDLLQWVFLSEDGEILKVFND